MIYLVLFIGLIVSINSCQKEEAFPIDENQTMTSTFKSTSAIIVAAQKWLEENPELNEYQLTNSIKKLQWNNAIMHDEGSIKIIEVSILLKDNHELKINKKDELNVDQRFLFIYEEGEFHSLMEFIVASDSKENIKNLNKINYGNRKNGFTGMFIYANTNDEIVIEQYSNDKESLTSNLKTETVSCLFEFYYYTDDPNTIYAEAIFCWKDIDNTSVPPPDGTTSGGTTGTDPNACPYPQCPDCGNYIIEGLKYVPAEGGEDIYEEETISCPPCTCSEPPCKGDPINNPSINPSSESGIYGGMFGCTRLGGSDCNEGPYTKFHYGTDITAPLNTPLYSMQAGRVWAVHDIDDGNLGKYVVIKSEDANGNDLYFLYAHLNSIDVSPNEDIVSGTQVIARTGNSGNADGPDITPHVHITVYLNAFTNSNRVDAKYYFSTIYNSDGTTDFPCISQ